MKEYWETNPQAQMGGGESDHHHQGESSSQTFCKLKKAVALQQSLQKTAKTFFQNTVQGLKSFLNGVSSDLKPAIKTLTLNPLSCTKSPYPHTDHYHHPQIYFSAEPTSDQLKPDHPSKGYYNYPTNDQRKPALEDSTAIAASTNNTSSRRHLIKASSEGAAAAAFMKMNQPRNNKSTTTSLPKSGSYHEGRRREEEKRNNLYLAQKMRDLEMLEVSDVDQTLDVVEALRCYSCLTSPVYLDLVDNFFMDMYADFSVPDARAQEIKNSSSMVANSRSLSRRVDSNRKLSGSSRRFGSSRRVHDSSSQRFTSSGRLGPIKAV